MSISIATVDSTHVTASPSFTRPVAAPLNPVVPALNTIRAVSDHAPAEIVELENNIQLLQQKLMVAYARKRLLEQLLAVIRDSDPMAGAPRPPQPTMALVR